MPDNDSQTPPATSPEITGEQTGTPEATSTAPLTLEAIRAAISEETAKQNEIAYKTARRAENKADSLLLQMRREIEPIRALMEEQTLAQLPEGVREAYLKGRDSERQQREDPRASMEREQRVFQEEAASILDEEGINLNDAVFQEAYGRFRATADTPAKWRTALGRAVAAVHKERASKASANVADQVKKAQADAEIKTRNATREAEGTVDRATPSASPKTRDWLAMDPMGKDFKAIEAEKESARRARRISANR